VRDFFRRREAIPIAVKEILEMCGMEEFVGRFPEELSYGRRRLLSIARALASSASVLLIDEPVAGLDSDESLRFGEVIAKLAREKKMSVLVIEHDMQFVMAVCDWVVVMDAGRKISEGTPSAVQNDPVAIAAYLGEEPATAVPSPGVARSGAIRSGAVQTGGQQDEG
jgi:ABC-type branched-subunit amino acid transport system ATPase component